MKGYLSFPKFITLSAVAASSFLLSSCFLLDFFMPSGPKDIRPVKEQIWDYYSSKLDETPAFESGFSAYFDFSDGMSEAYKDPDTRANLQGITQKITGSDWIVYGMASNRLDTLRLSQTELYNKITQPRYTDIMAPIEKALESIVSNRKRALLVTDFEEYTADRRIQYQNYAKRYFAAWLKGGGVVNFYITDYKEGRQDKHLYFAVFDDAEGTMTSIIDDALVGRRVNYQRFSLTNRPVEIIKTYSNPLKGGNYHDASGNDNVTAVNEDDTTNDMYCSYDGGRVEFYPCGVSWSDMYENAIALAQLPGTDRFYSLFRGIVMDASTGKDSYRIDDYALRVTNVQKDFAMFTNYQAALRNPPTITRNPDGSQIVEFTEHPDAQYYYDQDGRLFAEYDYTPQSCPEIPNLLMLDKAVMSESNRQNPDQTEIAIDFSDNFSKKSLDVESCDLIRVDVVIAKATPQLDRLDGLFAWGADRNGQTNRNLSEAIRNTLQEQDINPQGQVLFTYFLRAY